MPQPSQTQSTPAARHISLCCCHVLLLIVSVESFCLLRTAAKNFQNPCHQHCITDVKLTLHHHDRRNRIIYHGQTSSVRFTSMRDDFDADPSIIDSSSLLSPSNNVEYPLSEDANEMMIVVSNKNTTTNILKSNTNEGKWNASDYENDYKLLKIAMSKQSATTNLHQQRRKYTLDYGFARNRRPLFRDLLTTTLKITTLTVLLVSGNQRMGVSGGGAVSSRGGYDITSLLQAFSWRHVHILATKSIHSISILYHWIMCMTLPLVLLTIIKLDKLGPMARTLEVWKQSSTSSSSSYLEDEDVPSFFYTRTQQQKKTSRDKDTSNYVLCLLENWSSAVVIHFAFMLVGRGRRFVSIIDSKNTCVRLLVHLGAVASLHQYPSLLFELYRDDQPRPLCRSTSYMQRAVKLLFNLLPIAVSSDLAMLLGRKGTSFFGNIGAGTLIASSLSILSPLCHLIALSRIVRISKSSAISLSEASTFVSSDDLYAKDEQRSSKAIDNQRIQWRYQLRWRTPQRLAVMLQTWKDYFFTNHAPLLLEMNEWNTQHIRFDDYSTEGHSMRAFDDIPDADAIIDSLSLIFRDRNAAIQNATQARIHKHQESYDTKTLDDVLGVAVQQTFDIGLSYDFDHFDSPANNGDEISIHQLRARTAKSAVRRKRELDGTMENELAALQRLKDDAVTATNTEVAEEEMQFVKQKIRDRHANEVNQMRNALLNIIPTDADAPKGTERYDSPIMVAEYVDLEAIAPTRRGELQVTKDIVPDSLIMIEEYVRRDYGDDAADAYRQDEIAARQKEKQMLLNIRQRSGDLKDDDDQVTESEPTFPDVHETE